MHYIHFFTFITYLSLLDPTASKAKLLLLKLIHLFARDVLLVKKLEIEETKTTHYSTIKTIKVGLVFSIPTFSLLKRLWQMNG